MQTSLPDTAQASPKAAEVETTVPIATGGACAQLPTRGAAGAPRGIPAQRGAPIPEGRGDPRRRKASERAAASAEPKPGAQARPDRSLLSQPRSRATVAWRISSRWSTGCRMPLRHRPERGPRPAADRRGGRPERRQEPGAREFRRQVGSGAAPGTRTPRARVLRGLGTRPRRRRDLVAPGAHGGQRHPRPHLQPEGGGGPLPRDESPSGRSALHPPHPRWAADVACGRLLTPPPPPLHPLGRQQTRAKGCSPTPVPPMGTEAYMTPRFWRGSLEAGSTLGPCPQVMDSSLLSWGFLDCGGGRVTPPVAPGRGHRPLSIGDQIQSPLSHYTSAAPAAIREQRKRGRRDCRMRKRGGERAPLSLPAAGPLPCRPLGGGGACQCRPPLAWQRDWNGGRRRWRTQR